MPEAGLWALPGLWLAAAVPLALGIDAWLGEPPVRWHPVVWIGHYLGWAGRRVAPPAEAVPQGRGARWGCFALGALAWLAGAALVWAVSAALQGAVQQAPGWLAVPLLALCLKPLLAWRMLASEVQAVEAALAESLEAGRARLAWLVSRDVAQLSAAQVRESALESLAENLNDSVVAPLFWFALFGLPGAALYRFANTADAMWGYPGARAGRHWQWAGKWAARADDLLSWLPARLTAWLLLCGGGAGPSLWRAVRREAARTPSPNSGWPMAALALCTGLRLEKPGVYVLNAPGRSPGAQDTSQALRLAQKVVWMLTGIAVLAMVLMVFEQGLP
ncbi:MAG: adenosylcobinamide-phosphate synthase CbiB [Burkholderiaceae bacterium]|nr:adenosylcobinamide-phosphate synthase CbiB [Burkholderiaceae bacterium]